MAVESLKLKVDKTLLFVCEAHFLPFPPQSDSRVFLWVNVMKPRKLVFGVGVNDADYDISKFETIGYVDGKRKRRTVWRCLYYSTWVGMLRRCYSKKNQERRPTYRGCAVSEDWLTFSNFKSWMEKQEFEGKQLDKDILFEGNKIYSPETCVFISGVVNNFTIDRGADRGEYLIGTYWNKEKGKFQSQCRNPFTEKLEYLGRFTSEQEAHQAWRKRKLELAHELAATQTDARVAKALINRYSN